MTSCSLQLNSDKILKFPVFVLTKDHLLQPIQLWELRQYGNLLLHFNGLKSVTTWRQKCTIHHKRNQITSIQCHYRGNSLGSSLFLWKTKYPHFQTFKMGQKVLLGKQIWFLYDWKDSKGKETPCELVGTHLRVDIFFGSTLKILAIEANYFDVFYVYYI